MKSLTIQIPDDVADGLVTEAALRHVTPEQLAAERLIEISPKGASKSAPTYASFFGAAKGRPGAHGSVEAVDRYVAEQRSEW